MLGGLDLLLNTLLAVEIDNTNAECIVDMCQHLWTLGIKKKKKVLRVPLQLVAIGFTTVAADFKTWLIRGMRE